MKLVITTRRESMEDRDEYANAVGGVLSIVDLDGLSTIELREALSGEFERQKREHYEIVIVSADSRLLYGAQVTFGFDSIFIGDGLAVRNIQGCTKRTLRTGHNLAKLFDANEFYVGV